MEPGQPEVSSVPFKLKVFIIGLLGVSNALLCFFTIQKPRSCYLIIIQGSSVVSQIRSIQTFQQLLYPNFFFTNWNVTKKIDFHNTFILHIRKCWRGWYKDLICTFPLTVKCIYYSNTQRQKNDGENARLRERGIGNSQPVDKKRIKEKKMKKIVKTYLWTRTCHQSLRRKHF